MSLAGSNGKSGAAASREISLACQQTMQARIRVRDRHGSCPKQTVVLTIQFSSMEHHAFHVPYLLDTTPEAAFHGQAVKTVVYLRVSTTQQVLGPEARTPEGLAGRLTARWQGGRNPALPRTGRFQDRHRQVWTCPVPPSTAHEHPRAQAEPLACISTRILSVPCQGFASPLRALDCSGPIRGATLFTRGRGGGPWGARTGCQGDGLANAGRHQPKVATPRPRYLVRAGLVPRRARASRGRCPPVARGCSPQRGGS